MPMKLISCMSLSDATISSVPICDFADANEELAGKDESIVINVAGRTCGGCVYS
jgi:hypothetical protein